MAIISGCLGFGEDIETDNPTQQQLDFCEAVMHLNPGMVYTPVGIKLIGSGIDDAAWMVFFTEETQTWAIFDTTYVFPDSLLGTASMYSLDDMPEWWNPSECKLTGGIIELSDGCFINVGMNRTSEGTVVFIFWNEI
jgi:hypothetical protein